MFIEYPLCDHHYIHCGFVSVAVIKYPNKSIFKKVSIWLQRQVTVHHYEEVKAGA